MFYVILLAAGISIAVCASEPQKKRILHGHTIYSQSNHPAITTQDAETDHYFWNPAAPLIKVTQLNIQGFQTRHITETPIWGGLIALKKFLPQIFPTEIIAEIALHALSEPAPCTKNKKKDDKQKEYNKRERYFIAYEFISDDEYKNIRSSWLLQFFFRMHKPTIPDRALAPKFPFCAELPKPHIHPYKLISNIERSHDLYTYNKLASLINSDKDYTAFIMKIIELPTNPPDQLAKEAILLAIDYHKIDLLKKLETKIELSTCYARDNKSLLQLSISPEITEYLLKSKVNVNHVDNNGLTPLLSALDWQKFRTDKHQIEIIEKLLAAGAYKKSATFDAIARAKKSYCSEEVIKLLEQWQ